jgi:hypothetical protein
VGNCDPYAVQLRSGQAGSLLKGANDCAFSWHPALFMIDAKLTASHGLQNEDLEEVNTCLKVPANQDLESKKPSSQRKE